MDVKQGVRKTVETIIPDLPATSRGGRTALISKRYSGNATTEELEAYAEGLLLPVPIVSGGLRSDTHSPPPPSNVCLPVVGHSATSQKSLSSLSFTVTGSIESSTGNPVTLVGDIANAAATASTGNIKDQAQAFVLEKLRSTVFTYVAKLPIVGPYLVDTKNIRERNMDTSATETTPLLGAIHDPKAFATKQAEGVLRRLLSPLSNRLPDVDALDDTESDGDGPLVKIFVECYVLARDGGGWLLTHLQEHSLVVAPTISLGHLSTTGLAASTIGTAVASVTGYSIIQGFISSLDKVLANAPNRRTARIACAQAALVTGVVHFQLPTYGSFTPKPFFSAAGLPGYAISEITKRYLASQGLSNVHTRILSATAPLNLVLNYFLVDGPVPALRLGFAGAPLSTVLSHNALAIMLTVYVVQRVIREEMEYLRGLNVIPGESGSANGNSIHPPAGTQTSELPQGHSEATFFTGLGTLVFSGIFGVSKSASQLWSKDFGGGEFMTLYIFFIIDNISVVASILGPDALATQAILLTTVTTLYQAPKAMSHVSTQRVKKWMTKGDVQRAKTAASVAFVGTLGGVIVLSNVLLASATSWGQLFNNDPVIIQNVSGLLPVISVFQAVHGIGAWVDSSLGALGKTAVFPSVNASADYFVGIPLGVYLALTSQWGLAGLWVGLTVSLAYSCLVATVVLVRTNWKNAAGKRGEDAPEGGQ